MTFLHARLAMLGLAVAISILPSAARASSNTVPCNVLGQGDCANPFLEGVVDGQWLGLIFQFGGGNGGATAADVESIGYGGNGWKTVSLGEIKAEGEYGDRMFAKFVHAKLYVFNAVYLPGEAHCCFTHYAVRRYGFHDRQLMMERLATVPTVASQSDVDRALNQGAHYF